MTDSLVGQPVAMGKPDFSPARRFGAVVLTVFFPFISLIVALVLRGSEIDPVRRGALRIWALASGAWLAAGVLIAIVALAAAGTSATTNQPSSDGPCLGGPVIGAAGTPVGNGNYRFACSLGGSTVMKFGG